MCIFSTSNEVVDFIWTNPEVVDFAAFSLKVHSRQHDVSSVFAMISTFKPQKARHFTQHYICNVNTLTVTLCMSHILVYFQTLCCMLLLFNLPWLIIQKHHI